MRLRRGCLRHALQTRAGRCLVCGRFALFLVTNPEHIRENAWCVWCGSSARSRHVAKCVVQSLPQHGLRCVGDLAAAHSLRIYNMSARGCFAEIWGACPHITYSEYLDGVPSGDSRDGILCEDVQGLSFEDCSFDLIISEDVFEHVEDYRQGFWEVRRVLKPGGHHIFSVPVGFAHPTLARFETQGSREVSRLPIEYHGDPIRGQVPVRTSFGYDLLDFLGSLGFEARLEISRYDEDRRFGTFDCATFVTRRC
jgi:SAM-dependent methyltransferase